MQVLVKMPHIKIDMKGDIPAKIIKLLKSEYGDDVKIKDDDDSIDVKDSQWYKKMSRKMTPGDYLRIYRENLSWTQERLGKELGGIPRQHISNMEKGRRAISVDMAEKLATLFRKPVSRFL